MIEKYTNDSGRECYRGVTRDTPFTAGMFHNPDWQPEGGEQWALHTNLGSLTVVDRVTGFGWRDVESGYRNKEGLFWLASGHVNVMYSKAGTVGEAIDYVIAMSNACRPDPGDDTEEHF